MGELDILNREIFVNDLVTLIENISGNRKSVSFAINGAWGCGKSFVLNMLEERLSQYQLAETASDKYFIIRYNCWKYDYYEEPLIAIVAAMIDMKFWKAFVSCLLGVMIAGVIMTIASYGVAAIF